MYHTPLTWYEQENLGYKAHTEALAPSFTAVVFASLLVRSWMPRGMRDGPAGCNKPTPKPLTQRSQAV
jgi:hypothetical protein